jgi:hypothetical protein
MPAQHTMLEPTVRHRVQLSMRASSIAVFFLCVSLLAHAQSEDSALTRALHSAAESAAAYQQSVPNFTCNETIRSELRKGKKVKFHVDTTGTFRVVRTADLPTESRHIVTANGKAVPDGDSYPLPIVMIGGFGNGLPVYFGASRQACFLYSFSAGRIDFEALPDAPKRAACNGIAPQARGFALLDAAGAITHIERRVPEAVALATNFATFTALDYFPVAMNGHVFTLPSHVVSEIPRNNLMATFDAHYSACRFYSGTITLEPAAPINQ